MLQRTFLLLALWLFTAAAQADDVYIYNTTDERMTYEVTFPSGDSKTGEIAESTGYGPNQTTVKVGDGVVTVIKLMRESGASPVELKATPTRCYVVAVADDGIKVVPAGWSMENGQKHKREMTIFNATGAPQTFDLIDEKEIRKDITLEAGQSQTFPSQNAFGGRRGYHTLRFANGDRVENEAPDGDFVLLFKDKRSPGKVQVKAYGRLTAPLNTPTI